MAIDFVILSKNTSFCAGFTRNLIPVSQYIGFHIKLLLTPLQMSLASLLMDFG